MKKIIITLCLMAFILWPLSLEAEPFPMPDMPERERMEVKIHYEGKKLDLKKSSVGQRMLYYESPKALKMEMKWVGEGAEKYLQFNLIEQLNNGNIATNIFKFKPSSKNVVLREHEKIVRTAMGKKIRREFYNLENPFLEYPDDLQHSYTLQVAFRGLDLEKKGSKHRFHLWLPPNIVVPMEIKMKGKETVEFEGKSRETYRVDMVPDMAEFIGPVLAKILSPILPKWQFWFETRGTHPFVKYKGPLGKVNVIGVPDEVYNLVKVDPDPARK